MIWTYSIYPSIGVARVGNSGDAFFLAPDKIGGLPIECDSYGNEQPEPFSNFKDASGQVKRQGQKFRIYRKDSKNFEEELTLDHQDVASIEWTVHLANKKAAWYTFSEYKGNLLFGEANSYENQKVQLRNNIPGINRQELIIDPGPRKLSGREQSEELNFKTIPHGYPGHFPFPHKDPTYGCRIDTIGDLKTDRAGRLTVLGGFGKSGGDKELSSYGGADTWYDDISDGSVVCTITLKNSEVITLKAWVITGPPDFAPEIVNISTWDDTIFDVGVRHFDLVPNMYKNSQGWNHDFYANYKRDILPIIQRISGYHWVANVQSMIAFSSNIFDFSDPSEGNKENRQRYFSYFRQPEPPYPDEFPASRQYTLFSRDQVPQLPMMPLNSGSNSVSNYNIEKFLALTQTQYFLLKQWADGKFNNDPDVTYAGVDKRNRASVGNVVGLPQCPGIEVTWTTQHPNIYEEKNPYQIKHKEVDYHTGLTPSRDECEDRVQPEERGCEPGDLTKRMAIPWQADFFNCSVQYINFTDPTTNKVGTVLAPKPPTYYSYWWPPQAPWDVISSDESELEQEVSGIPAGLQVNFIRGVNSYKQMVNNGWSYLAFIRNKNAGDNGHGQMFPYLVETERDNNMFSHTSVPIGKITQREDDDGTEVQVFYLKEIEQQRQVLNSRLITRNLPDKLRKVIQEFDNFREIEVVEEERQRIPRSGRRVRF